MPRGRTSGEIAIAASVCALGFLVLAALLAHVLDPSGSLLGSGGALLFRSFSWAAFLIPAFLFASAALALAREVRARRLAALALSAFPFLTLSLLLKIAPADGGGSPLSDLMLSAFGRAQGITTLALALGLELSILAALAFTGRGAAFVHSGEQVEETQAPEVLHEVGRHDPPGIVPLAANLVRLLEEPFASRDSRDPFAAASVRRADAPRSPMSAPAAIALAAPEVAEAAVGEAEVGEAEPREPEVVEIEPAELFVEDTPGPEGVEAEARDEFLTEAGEPGRLQAGGSWDALSASDVELIVESEDAETTMAERPPEWAEAPVGESVEAPPEDPSDVEIDDPADGDISLEGNALVDVEATDSADAEPERSRARKRLRAGYRIPVDGILKQYEDGAYWEIDSATQRAAEVLKDTLEEFSISAEVTGIRKGPVITMFEVLPAPGVKISKIANLADNIALRLAASRVRIVAPIPGKHAVGIEVPNRERAIVSLREMVSLPEFQNSKFRLPVVLGKGISGEAKIIDLTQTPHLLIAGATGAGKSVCVNALICSILYSKSPEEARLILVDPKIVELKYYNDIPHLLTPVITDMKRSYQALQYCICEMERRYALLDALGVRDIASYNRKVNTGKTTAQRLPYIIFVIDEFADLMAQSGKEMESTLARLAAMSRAVGIHLVLATQRPSIDVITGLIKANIPSRVAFMVASKFDSRIIIDGVGAEKLLGKGDMLFTASWDPFPQRLQGAFISEEEVEAVAAHVRTLGEPDYIDDEMFIDEDDDFVLQSGEDDPLFDQALEIVVVAGKASASYLQRRLKIGYNRAARLVEDMERRGIVGPSQGSKPRDVIHVPERPK